MATPTKTSSPSPWVKGTGNGQGARPSGVRGGPPPWVTETDAQTDAQAAVEAAADNWAQADSESQVWRADSDVGAATAAAAAAAAAASAALASALPSLVEATEAAGSAAAPRARKGMLVGTIVLAVLLVAVLVLVAVFLAWRWRILRRRAAHKRAQQQNHPHPHPHHHHHQEEEQHDQKRRLASECEKPSAVGDEAGAAPAAPLPSRSRTVSIHLDYGLEQRQAGAGVQSLSRYSRSSEGDRVLPMAYSVGSNPFNQSVTTHDERPSSAASAGFSTTSTITAVAAAAAAAARRSSIRKSQGLGRPAGAEPSTFAAGNVSPGPNANANIGARGQANQAYFTGIDTSDRYSTVSARVAPLAVLPTYRPVPAIVGGDDPPPPYRSGVSAAAVGHFQQSRQSRHSPGLLSPAHARSAPVALAAALVPVASHWSDSVGMSVAETGMSETASTASAPSERGSLRDSRLQAYYNEMLLAETKAASLRHVDDDSSDDDAGDGDGDSANASNCASASASTNASASASAGDGPSSSHPAPSQPKPANPFDDPVVATALDHRPDTASLRPLSQHHD